MTRNPFSRRGEFLGWTWGLVFLHVATFVFSQSQGASASQLLGYLPGALAEGRWWTPLTYQFVDGSMLSLFFNVLGLYFLGLALEHEWGTFTYVVFWLVGTLGAFAAAALLGFPLIGSVFLPVSYLIVYALLWPETQFLIFFVFPVKVKWIAAVTAGLLVFEAMRYGPLFGLVYLLGMGGGVGFYYAAIRPRKSLLRVGTEKLKEAGRVSTELKLDAKNRSFFERAGKLRPPGGVPEEVTTSPDLEKLRTDLRAAVRPDVQICKPVDYKGDGDGICIRCEGFAECTLRWLRGEPAEIVPAKKDENGQVS